MTRWFLFWRTAPRIRWSQELRGFIGALTLDEQVDLVTLTWLGRGDGTVEEWDQLRAEALGAHNNRTASYLLGTPLLADFLEEGLSQLGLACDEFEMGAYRGRPRHRRGVDGGRWKTA